MGKNYFHGIKQHLKNFQERKKNQDWSLKSLNRENELRHWMKCTNIKSWFMLEDVEDTGRPK